MIYIFNSGFYNEYSINVLNTLHLPEGAHNTYRYSILPDHNFVEERVKNDNLNNEDVMIIFIDRYSEGGFTFYPIRKGKLLAKEIDQGKIYLTVQLFEYYAVRSIETFNQYFVNKFSTLIPRINPNNNPDIDGPGYFAFIGDDCSKEFSSVGDTWFTTVQRLSEVKIFKEAFTIFTKVSFKENKNVSYKTENDNTRFLLKRNETYNITINYYFREQVVSDKSYAEIELVEKARSFTLPSTKKTIDNKTGKLEYDLITQKIPDQRKENIEVLLSNSSNIGERKTFIAKSPINITIVDNKKIWTEIIVYASLIGIIQWLLALDPVSIYAELTKPNITLSVFEKVSLWIATGLLDIKYLYQALLRVANVGLTILMFYRYGKKVL